MTLLSNLAILVSLTVWILGLVAGGHLEPAVGALALVALVGIGGLSRSIGLSVWLPTLRLALPLMSLVTFAVVFGGDALGAYLVAALIGTLWISAKRPERRMTGPVAALNSRVVDAPRGSPRARLAPEIPTQQSTVMIVAILFGIYIMSGGRT